MLSNCEILIAPHHGRGSDRSFEFLDEIKPRFGILGCARAKHIAYDAWNTRKIDKIMQNQSGNIVIYPKNDGNNKKSLFVYIENKRYAEDCGDYSSKYKDSYGNYLYKIISLKRTINFFPRKYNLSLSERKELQTRAKRVHMGLILSCSDIDFC